jgi:AcrR family transcriptional regulator
MARVQTITDDQILEAARQVFLEQGFNAPATDIAAKAGISSGSIFKRYATKEDLFFAAMSCASKWSGGLEKLVGHGELKINLEAIANAIFSFAHEMLPRTMLSWSLRHSASQEAQETQLEKDIFLLSEFLKAEQGIGRLRPSLETHVTANTIVGTMINYALLEVLSGKTHDNPELFIKEFVDTFWKGLIANPTDVF